jgi:phenylacetate-CoA ligase
MSDVFDELEVRLPEAREEALLAAVRHLVRESGPQVPALAERVAGIEPDDLRDRSALARIPVLRKQDLMERQAREPPFGGFADLARLRGRRIYQSPGPIWEVGDDRAEAARATARAFFAAGVRAGDVVHNAFGHHMTPGGFLLDAGARALGCAVFPAGVGNTDQQVEAAASLRPGAYTGTPDFLKILLDRALEAGKDLSSFRRALVSGGALFPSLRAAYRDRGIAVMQCYATAEFGAIAYESMGTDGLPLPGMVVNEHVLVEIVRPGTSDPVPDGEVGEVVVTGFDPVYPLLRLGTGDLSAVIAEPSPCGRTNMRIRGWMGRADQRTKVKGMFVDPAQVAEIVRTVPGAARARLVVSREAEADVMTLQVEPQADRRPDAVQCEAVLRSVTGLGGRVEVVDAGSLPNDGKVISDERDYAT